MGKGQEIFVNLYKIMIEHGQFKDALTTLADFARKGIPSLFHCFVGKDRTGVTACLLLRLAGVSEAEVINNYAESQVHLMPHQKMVAQQNPGLYNYIDPIILTGTPPYAMRYILGKLDEYG